MRFGSFAGAASIGMVLLTACSKDPPPPMPPMPPMTAQPAATVVATARVSAAQAGDLAPPGPTALSCQSDVQCLGHKCNLQAGRCAFPCAADSDCVSGAKCFLGGGPAAFCISAQPR